MYALAARHSAIVLSNLKLRWVSFYNICILLGCRPLFKGPARYIIGMYRYFAHSIVGKYMPIYNAGPVVLIYISYYGGKMLMLDPPT